MGNRRLAARLLAAACVVAALPACSGGGDGGGDTADATTTTEAVGVLEAAGLAARVHAGGFVLEVTEARIIRDQVGRAFLEVQTTLTNEGTEPATLVVPTFVETAEGVVERLVPSDEQPVPPGQPQPTALKFPVPPGVGERGEGLQGARLILGVAGNHRAIVPFDGSAPTALPPQPVQAAGSLTAGHVTLALEGGTLRFDDPLGHESLLDSRALITLSFTARRGAGGAPNLTAENFRLRLPDGSLVAVRRDGRSAPNVLLEANKSVPGLSVRFEVPFPASGTYALQLVGPYGADASEARGEVPIGV